MNRHNFATFEAADIYFFGLLVQGSLIFLIILKVSFSRLFFVFLLENIYVSFRMFYFENFDWTFFRALILCLSNFFALFSFAYGAELYHRKIYCDIKKHEKSLFLYEELVKEIILLSVIIYDDEKVYFSNRETFKILQLSENDVNSLKEGLEGFKIKIEKAINPPEKSPFLTLKNSEECDLVNFYNLINKMLPGNNKINCTIIPSSCEESESDKYSISIEFKISTIIWNEKTVKIILMNEDHNAKDLLLQQQREVFKDRFLASISHELRTPLNGMIGMILVALDLCKDKIITKRLLI